MAYSHWNQPRTNPRTNFSRFSFIVCRRVRKRHENQAKPMNNHGNEHIILTEQLQNGSLQNRDQTRTQPSVSEKQNGLQEEVELLRLEVDRLRDEQQAFQRTSKSDDLHDGDKVD